MDLRFAAIAFRRRRHGWRCALIGSNCEIEGVMFQRRRGAERGNYDRSLERFSARQKLVWQLFLRLFRHFVSQLRNFLFQPRRTTSTFALPLSFTLNGNVSSSPDMGSCKVTKAWCGLLPVFPSVVVRMILRVSAALSVIALDDREEDGESLQR